VDRLYDTDLNTVVSMLGNVSTYTIYYKILDHLRLLLHRAVFTFKELAADVAESEYSKGSDNAMQNAFH
jgi:hypothetical protein